jgi:hypothetical protein
MSLYTLASRLPAECPVEGLREEFLQQEKTGKDHKSSSVIFEKGSSLLPG